MIGGIQPCSFIDFPGNIAAVFFIRGCNLKCRYCHNPQLIPFHAEPSIPVPDALEFLRKRCGKLSGVVISGGEPSLDRGVPELLQAVRSIGFSVKLDTNGTQPDFVRNLVSEKLLDYAAVDIKITPGAGSTWLCGMENQAVLAIETVQCLVAAEIPCEARTTVVDGLHNLKEFQALARMLKTSGVRSWRLQPVEASTVLDTSVRFAPPDREILSQAVAFALDAGIDASVRANPV